MTDTLNLTGSYSAPASGAGVLNLANQPTSVVGVMSVPSPLGVPLLVGGAIESVAGRLSTPGPLAQPSLRGAPVAMGQTACASLLGQPAGLAQVVRRGIAAAPSPLASPRLVGRVMRFELRGEVRDQGVLVNRRVRAHRRSDGVLVAEADTVAGVFSLPAGFAAAEYYLIPINLDVAATDFAPPCVNRVTSVLAMDAAA